MLPYHVPDHFWSDDDSDHSLPVFFCLPTCCQLVANCCQLLPTCCQLVGNKLSTNDFVISQRIWACHPQKIFDYLLMWIREDSTHPSLIPRWRKVVVSPRFTPSHPPTKMCSKSIISRATALFLEAYILELSGSWVNNKVSNTLVPTFHEIFNERSDFPINRLLCGSEIFIGKKNYMVYLGPGALRGT